MQVYTFYLVACYTSVAGFVGVNVNQASLFLQGGFPAWEEFLARGLKFQKHFE